MKKNEPIIPGLEQDAARPLDLTPAKGHATPSVWVRALGVYKDWPPCQANLLHEVDLRRGLNIIWARPLGNAQGASKMAGHGAGKSTFCRLLRYVLDDETYGTESFREGLNSKFRNPWVLAVVELDSAKWLVGRPLGRIGHHPFAVKGGSFAESFGDTPPRGGYEEFVKALDSAVLGRMTLRTLAESQEELSWKHLLPWLTRDQEAHFSGLLDWRHKDSDSDSPSLSYEDKANLVRLILGLVADREQKLMAEFAAKAQLHEQKTRERVKLEYAIERERAKVELIAKVKLDAGNGELFREQVRQRVEHLRKEADQGAALVRQNAELDLLNANVSRREAEWGIADAASRELEEMVEKEEGRVKGSTPPTRTEQENDVYRDMLKSLGPLPGYCAQPIDEAYHARCPLAHEHHGHAAMAKVANDIGKEAGARKARLEGLRRDLARRKAMAEPKKVALDAARKDLTAARLRHSEELGKLRALSETASDLDAKCSGYLSSCEDLDDLDKELEQLKNKKSDLDAALALWSKQHRELMDRFGDLFNHVAQQMLGDPVTGRIRFVGKGIVPELEFHGPRDSAALKVAKWLAFDIASLMLGITSADTHHPRFLMHDSPREADLAAGIYASLFEVVYELEGSGNDKAPFQYIVTTTEPPPEHLKAKPYLVMELDASVSEGRFLGVDV